MKLAGRLTRAVVSAAGNAVVDGVAASNFVVQDNGRLILDALVSERVKWQARSHSSSYHSRGQA